MKSKNDKGEKWNWKLWGLIGAAFVALLFSTYFKVFHSSTWGERLNGDATLWGLLRDPEVHETVVVPFGVVILVFLVVAAVLWKRK